MPQPQDGKCNQTFHIGQGGRLYCEKDPDHEGNHGAAVEWNDIRQLSQPGAE